MTRLADLLVAGRRWLALAATLLIVASALGLGRLEFKNDYRMFFSSDNPELTAFEQLQTAYAQTDNLLIVVRAREGDLFTRDNLIALDTLTRRAWSLPAARRVDSPSNFQHSAAAGDELDIGPILPSPGTADGQQIARFRALILAEPMLLKRLVSPDGRSAGVLVSLSLDQTRKDEQVLELAAAARALVAEVGTRHAGLEIRLTGSAMLDTAFHEAAEADTRILVPTMLSVSLLLCWWLMRSAVAALVVGGIISFSILCALGIAGWLGIPLSPTALASPNIIMTLAVADSVHFLVGWQNRVAAGEPPAMAMRSALDSHLPFVGFTTAATLVSFLTMNFSDAPPFRDLGNITALGVLAAFLLTLGLLPCWALLLPPHRISRPRELLPRGLDRLLAFLRRHPRRYAAGGLVGALVISQGLWLNDLDDEFVKYFDRSLSFRQDTDWAERHLTGIYALEYALPSGSPEGIYDPAYLKAVDDFANWLRQQPEVSHVISLVDILKKLNRNMNGDDPAHYRVPESRELAAQYFLAYELGLPQGMDVSDRVDVARSGLRLTAALGNLSSEQVRQLEARARNWLDQLAPPSMRVAATGPSLMFANIGKRNILDMISGEVIGMIIVALLLGAALRSLRLGALALIPTVLPAAVAFGVWGLLVGQVGLASSVVAAMTLGILADDTVHFLGHYTRARHQGEGRDDAIAVAFHEAGQALWITSLVLISGFAVLAFSHFRINADLGLLTVLILILGLLADFVLLPAILLSGDASK